MKFGRALAAAFHADLVRQHRELRHQVLHSYRIDGLHYNDLLTRQRWGW